jgi:hypothetical protein
VRPPTSNFRTRSTSSALNDEGREITDHLDHGNVRRPGQEQRRVNVDFPSWMIESLDREAKRLGVTRQSIIKVWIAERLERKAS